MTPSHRGDSPCTAAQLFAQPAESGVAFAQHIARVADDLSEELQGEAVLLDLKSDGASPQADPGILGTTRVRVADDVVFNARQGRGMLLKRKSGAYFELDRVKTRIWQLFAEHKQLAEIAQTIAAEYDVAEDRCSAVLRWLVADLERHGLVVVS